VVRAALSEIDNIALTCDCPFWRWNGPEYHAKTEDYMLGQPQGTAAPPDIRDPDRVYYLCKHAYSVLVRLDDFVSDVVDENWGLDDEELLDVIDRDWDKLEAQAQVSLEDVEPEEIKLQWEAVEAIEPEDEDEEEEEAEGEEPEEEPEAEEVEEPEEIEEEPEPEEEIEEPEEEEEEEVEEPVEEVEKQIEEK